MKNLIVLLVICFPSFLFAQSKTKLELLGSLDYSYRINKRAILSQKGKLNSHFGVNYFQKLKSNLWLKIGVGFVSEGYKSKSKIGVFADALSNGGVSADPLAGKSVQIFYNFHFLEVPFSLHYDFSEKRFKPFFEFGLVPMYYLQSITKIKLDGESHTERIEQERVVNDFQLATKFAFGFSYSFNEKWEMVVQPNFRYHITKIADAPVKEHLWSVGLAVGMRMAMK